MAERRFLELTKRIDPNVIPSRTRKRMVDVDELVLIEESDTQYGCDLTLRCGRGLHVEESYAQVIASLEQLS